MSANMLQAFKAAGLPVADMAAFRVAAKEAAIISKATSSGVILLRLLKDGRWVYGSDDVEVQPDSLWAVNPFSMSMGYAAWGDERGPNKGKLMGERMATINQPQITLDGVPDVGEEWRAQRQFDLICLTGEDVGTLVRYKSTSLGCQKAFAGLMQEVSDHAAGDGHIVPVVDLKSDSYKHKTYGLTYVPIFEAVEWRKLDDASPVAAADEEKTAEADVPAPTSDKRRRSSAGAVADKPTEVSARVATALAGANQVERGATVRRTRRTSAK